MSSIWRLLYIEIMEVEYSGGGVLNFSYLILIYQLDDLEGLRDNFGSEFISCRFDGPPIAARLSLTNFDKRKAGFTLDATT